MTTKAHQAPSGTTATAPAVLCAHHLKQRKLPSVLREHEKVAGEAHRDGVDHVRYLLRLVELELLDREPASSNGASARPGSRRSRASTFSSSRPSPCSLNKILTLELARCEYVARRENVIALGNSATGKAHVALALGLAACQRGFQTLFLTAHAPSSQLIEGRDEKRLPNLQAQMQTVKLLIIDELGYVPLSQIGAELLFEVFSKRYEPGLDHRHLEPALRGTDVRVPVRASDRRAPGSAHHYVHILEMNGESYRLKQSTGRRKTAKADENKAAFRPNHRRRNRLSSTKSPRPVTRPNAASNDSAAAAARSLQRP